VSCNVIFAFHVLSVRSVLCVCLSVCLFPHLLAMLIDLNKVMNYEKLSNTVKTQRCHRIEMTRKLTLSDITCCKQKILALDGRKELKVITTKLPTAEIPVQQK